MKSVKVSVVKPPSDGGGGGGDGGGGGALEGPILTRFPGGVPPFDETDVRLLGNTAGGPRRQAQRRLIATVSEECRFVGENFGRYATAARQPCGYAVAEFDPATRTLVIHPVKTTLTMDVVVDLAGAEEQDDDLLSGMSNRSRRQLLIDAFGSRKRKRDQKAKQASQITSSNIAGGEAVQALLRRSASKQGASAKKGTAQELSLIHI